VRRKDSIAALNAWSSSGAAACAPGRALSKSSVKIAIQHRTISVKTIAHPHPVVKRILINLRLSLRDRFTAPSSSTSPYNSPASLPPPPACPPPQSRLLPNLLQVQGR